MKELVFSSLAAHERALQSGDYTARELLDAYLERIDKYDGESGVYLSLDRDGAYSAARVADERLQSGRAYGALDGIPFAAKDNLCTRGLRTTCASKMLEHHIPPYDATVIARLREQGGVLLGKTNMDEFGMGSSTEHSALGVTRNPHDPTRVAGGSSGGAAAAVAACLTPFALASDTGGSIRQPAAFCGVLGLKPTYGALSRYGLIAFASSLDCVGILARSADDCARVFFALAGRDPHDATSAAYPHTDACIRSFSLANIRLGIADTDFSCDASAYAVDDAVKALCRQGVRTVSATLPSPREALAAYYVISSAEASSNLARYDGVRYGYRSPHAEDLNALYEQSRAEGFGDEVKRRILFGTYVLSERNREALYLRACTVREEIKTALLSQLRACDVLILPTAPTTAFRFGERQTPAQMYASDLCTVYASLAGLPALSVPFGRDPNGLPRAVQLIAPSMEERRLLALAKKLEEIDL